MQQKNTIILISSASVTKRNRKYFILRKIVANESLTTPEIREQSHRRISWWSKHFVDAKSRTLFGNPLRGIEDEPRNWLKKQWLVFKKSWASRRIQQKLTKAWINCWIWLPICDWSNAKLVLSARDHLLYNWECKYPLNHMYADTRNR